MYEEIPCTNDLQSNEYDMNDDAYPNCVVHLEEEPMKEGMLTNLCEEIKCEYNIH